MLKLAALDADDLTVISACMQDSVLKTGEIAFAPAEQRLVLPVNRFAWEKSGDRSSPDTVLSILAIRFEPSEAPAGTVEVTFAGGGALKFDVECIEAQLADLGPAWAAKGKPKHGV